MDIKTSPVLALALALVVSSCERDEFSTGTHTCATTEVKRNSNFPRIDSTGIGLSGWGTIQNKRVSVEDYADGYRYYGSNFHDCGWVYINGVRYPTVMAGNQRWVVGYYRSNVDGYGRAHEVTDIGTWRQGDKYPSIISADVEYNKAVYYPKWFRDTFSSYKSQRNIRVPKGFKELSDWHVPTEPEWASFSVMTMMHNNPWEEANEEFVLNMGLTPTGFFYKGYGDGVPTLAIPDMCVVATSSVNPDAPRVQTMIKVNDIETERSDGTMQLAIDSLYFPMMLMQKVEPIFYKADSTEFYDNWYERR